jgi:acyl carrier protein
LCGRGRIVTQQAASNREGIRSAVRAYLLSDVLSGEEPEALQDSTELISSGVLDSISTARLVTYLEGEFGIRFKASEIGAAHLNTVDLIVRTVESKL